MPDNFNEMSTWDAGVPEKSAVAFPVICLNVKYNHKYFLFQIAGLALKNTNTGWVNDLEFIKFRVCIYELETSLELLTYYLIWTLK